jgi:hypothetical protein
MTELDYQIFAICKTNPASSGSALIDAGSSKIAVNRVFLLPVGSV